VTPAGKRRLVRIWIDRVLPESADATTTVIEPLTLDEVADATRAVGDALDETDAMGEQAYTLEVTSPGVDRPLTEPRHFRRNVTRLVTLTPSEGPAVTGRIVSAGPDSVTIEVPAAKKTPARAVELAYAAVSRAVVEVEFSRPSSDAAAAHEDAADADPHDDEDLNTEDLDDEHDGDDDTDDDTEEN
jgi:ribosome maturation factor RimP